MNIKNEEINDSDFDFRFEPRLLRHLVAMLAFRGGITISDVPEYFSKFRAGENARSAGKILANIGDLFEGSLCLVKGELVRLQSSPQIWEEVTRFFNAAREFDLFLASGLPFEQPIEKIMQGSVVDALTAMGP